MANEYRFPSMMFGANPQKVRQPSFGSFNMGGQDFGARPLPMPAMPPMAQQPQEDQYASMMERIFNQPNPSITAYKQHLNTMPNREDYKPNIGNRVLTGLVGAAEGIQRGAGAGVAAGQAFMDRPYNEALMDYQNKGNRLGQLAELEDKDVRSKMTFAASMMEEKRKNRDLDIKVERYAAQNGLNKAQTDKIMQELKTGRIELKQNDKTGEMMRINLDTGEQTSMGQYAQTPEEKARTEVDKHRQTSGIDLGNKKNLFDFELPKTEASQIKVHEANRMSDAANPISNTTGFNSLAPSQGDIAHNSAIGKVIMKNPNWYKFADPNPANAKEVAAAAAADRKGYEEFLAAVDQVEAEIISKNQKTPVTATARPRPNVGTIAPITAPAAPQVNFGSNKFTMGAPPVNSFSLPGTNRPVPPPAQMPMPMPPPATTPAPITKSAPPVAPVRPIAPPKPPASSGTTPLGSPVNDPRTARAIEELRKDGQPITPAMIEWMLKQPDFQE